MKKKIKLLSFTMHEDKDLLFVLPTAFCYLDKGHKCLEIGATFLYYTFLITINKPR